jgi:iron-sulfur cluster repair protein YtfE (RIC family)
MKILTTSSTVPQLPITGKMRTTTTAGPVPAKKESRDSIIGYQNTSAEGNKTTRSKENKEEISDIVRPIIQAFHEQYKQNLELQHENALAKEIRQVYCQLSVLRRVCNRFGRGVKRLFY